MGSFCPVCTDFTVFLENPHFLAIEGYFLAIYIISPSLILETATVRGVQAPSSGEKYQRPKCEHCKYSRVCGECVLFLAGAELGHGPFVSLEFILTLPSRLLCPTFLRGWGFSLTA